LAGPSARGGRRVEHVEELFRIGLAPADRVDHLRRPSVHPAGALRGRRGEHQAAHQCGAGERDVLGDEAAERESQDVGAVDAERVEEGDGVAGHVGHGARGGPARGADTGVVERDDPPVGGEQVDEGGIPVVQVAAEVHERDQRNAVLREVTVGVGDAVGCRDELV
jgi:hypothetical protein